jgi:hypothetical protein
MTNTIPPYDEWVIEYRQMKDRIKQLEFDCEDFVKAAKIALEDRDKQVIKVRRLEDKNKKIKESLRKLIDRHERAQEGSEPYDQLFYDDVIDDVILNLMRLLKTLTGGEMFEQIKKDYPKGWEKFNKFYYSINTNCLTTKYLAAIEIWQLIGDLFLFFDELGIIIEILPGKLFSYSIYSKQFKPVFEYTNENDFKTREEVWKAAITKSFEIFEKVLEEK